MNKFALTFVFLTVAVASVASAGGPRVIADKWGMRMARTRSWHGHHYYQNWGHPTALVVPPTAHMQGSFAWGVTQNTTLPIYHQFRRPYPGEMPTLPHGGMGYLPKPYWPSHTDQFGVYSVRGPW